jgi:hypothetical protein
MPLVTDLMRVAHAMRALYPRTVDTPAPIDRARLGVGCVAVIDAEHALDAADRAADRSTNYGADGTGDAAAFMKAMRGAAGNALRLRGERECERCKHDACEY